MEKLMKDTGLEKLFGDEEWPAANAVRKLSTKINAAKKATGNKDHVPYMSPDLKECVAVPTPWPRLGHLALCQVFA